MQRHDRLSVHDLCKHYGPTTVLDGVSFRVPAATLAVVAGANGAGKSTLLRCLAGLATFTGTASLDGQQLPGARSLRRAIGYLPQDVAFPDAMTVEEVLELFTTLRGANLQSAGLPDGFLPRMSAPVGTLSGGQRQRVAAAIALLGRPQLLLLDEPTANLDSWAAATLWQVVREHRDDGATVLVASPRTADVVDEADVLLELVDRAIEMSALWASNEPSVEVVG